MPDDNITIRISEKAKIGNPVVPGGYVISVSTKLPDSASFDSRKLFFGPRITISPEEPGEESVIRVEFRAPNNMEANKGL